MLKSLTVWITTNCGKFLKRWEYQTTLPASWDLYAGQEATVRTSHRLVPNWERSRSRLICPLAYVTDMQNTSWENTGWMKHELESRLPGEISVTSDMQMIPPLRQKAERNYRASWWKWKRRVKMVAYSSTFKKLRSWHPVPLLHGK